MKGGANMSKPERKPSGNSVLRLVIVGAAFIVQMLWLFYAALALNIYSVWINLLTTVVSLVVVVRLHSKYASPAMRMSWIMLILAFPVMGLGMYLLFVILGDPGVGKELERVRERMRGQLRQDAGTMERLESRDLSIANQSRYLWNTARWPVYEDTKVDYYSQGVQAFEAMKADLEKAESFIFMEYFIVEDSSSFRELEQILVRKARQGVQVRLLYDDIGSAGYVNMAFARRLNEEGIRCHAFNPAMPMLNLFLNHRDHRKVTVIDGKVGFTGGYNLADAYFDRTHPHGQWKDTGLRLEGRAVRSLTAIFLELWGVISRKEQEDVSVYLSVEHEAKAPGFVQPFADNPLGKDRVAEDVYLNLAFQANQSLYFMTPYLIITDEMTRTLGLAAKRGVDVRIITPGVPDKKTVFAVTRSYYAGLTRQGVRIYEFTPGFCHAKMCICDGKVATVGTSNLDFRSLYHHFENNVLLTGCEAVEEVARDFEEMFPQCQEVTQTSSTGRGAALRIWQCILRLFAPLL